MVLLITHPDYMFFGNRPRRIWDYAAEHYIDLLKYLKEKYEGEYWHALPKDVARFWADRPNKDEGF